MTRHLAACASVALVFLAGAPAWAQAGGTDAPPAHVSFVDGTVVLERDGRPDSSPSSMPLLAGDRLRTETGRAEVLFADGSALHIDNHTVVDFQSDEVLRLIDGRLRLSIAGRERDVSYRIDAPGGWVQIAEPGEYRIAVLRGEREPQVELAVLRGAAELVNEDGRSLIRAGERAFARAGAQPSPPYVFNSAAWDAFDRWSETRRDQRLGVSAQYLPPDVRTYSATFDHYGSWQYEPVHGYVWYPRVNVGWRPYYRGRWVSLRPYGWTWIAGDPWGWPTHHYGRWGISSGNWYWIPGRRWGSAWVSWAYASDYVSWCPLGWNDRPVFSFININVNRRRGGWYDPWHAWTVVPRRHFGSGYVNAHVVAGGRLDGRTRGSFVVRDSAPDWRYAVPRASNPIRTAGRTGYAVPRGSGNTVVSGGPARDRADDVRSSRSSAPVTAPRDRAVPRDRGSRDAFGALPDTRGTVTAPASPRSRDARVPDNTRRPDDAGATPYGSRAIPRRSPDVEPQRTPDRDSGRYDRSAAPRTIPEYRPETGARPDAGYRRAPEPDRSPDSGYRRAPEPDRSQDRYRAVPRHDAPRPSYEAPRESPRPSGDAPQRSFGGAPRSEPRSSGAAPERRAPSGPPPSAAPPPSRSAPSGDSGQSRPRGGQPSQGQAVRRPRG